MMTDPGYTAMLADDKARIESGVAPLITGPWGDEKAGAVHTDRVSANAVLDEGFLGAAELALLIHVDPSTLRRWRSAKPPVGPPFSRLSPGVVVYSIADVRSWIALRRIDPAGCA